MNYCKAIILLLMACNVSAEVSKQPLAMSLAGFLLVRASSISSEFVDYQARSQVIEALSLASGVKLSVVEYFAATHQCPDNTSLDIDKTHAIEKPTDLYDRYTERVVVKENKGECTITAILRKQGVATAIAGKTLTLTMTATPHSFEWSCHSDLDNRYLPITCRQ